MRYLEKTRGPQGAEVGDAGRENTRAEEPVKAAGSFCQAFFVLGTAVAGAVVAFMVMQAVASQSAVGLYQEAREAAPGTVVMGQPGQ